MRLALWCLGLAGLVLGTWLIWGGSWDAQFTLAGSVQSLERAGSWAWALGIFLLIVDLLLPVPSTIVISALGYCYGLFLGGCFATVGLMASGMLGYGVGYCLGEKVARKWLGDRDFENGRWIFTQGGAWVVALSKAVPILPEVISCTAGLVRMPFRQFVLALACGSVPMGFLFSAIGHLGREAPGWAMGLSFFIPGLLWALTGLFGRFRS
jgi:uncharacterized membrane protein YdjX (TVP38/TMEM64 family)